MVIALVAVAFIDRRSGDYQEFFDRHRADLERAAEMVDSRQLVAPAGEGITARIFPMILNIGQ